MNVLALIASVHGYFGVLSAVALLHPAILLRRGEPLSRRNRWLVALVSLAVSATYALGIGLYPAYRAGVKRELFQASLSAGLSFELKEHLAFLVLGLTAGAAVAAFAAPSSGRELRRAAATFFALAAVVACATAALGSYVSAIRSFASG
jgi:hypothetical protein